MNASGYTLRVISLRPENASDQTFEDALRNAGHKVTILSSTEPAFSLVSSSWPDVVIFDPISQFGMSGSIQRIRSSFDGVIVAAGKIPDPTITSMLTELGIANFATNSHELIGIIRNVPNRAAGEEKLYPDRQPVIAEPESSDSPSERQLILTEPVDLEPVGAVVSATESVTPNIKKPQVEAVSVGSVSAADSSTPANELAPSKSLLASLPFKQWHRSVVGGVVIAAVIIAVVIPFLRSQPVEPVENTAKALPVIPRILTEPLAPLTIEELSGEVLPLEISGIKDRAVIEKPAVAFWGDTAPDAFVTVNGEAVTVSEYGAFVVDYPLDDGANFIEILASDFEGRTTSKTFTVVSLQ
jgi:hypothetical protein